MSHFAAPAAPCGTTPCTLLCGTCGTSIGLPPIGGTHGAAVPRWCAHRLAAAAAQAARYVDGLVTARSTGSTEAAAFRVGAQLWAETIAAGMRLDDWLAMGSLAEQLTEHPHKVVPSLERLFENMVLADGARIVP